ncbi:MAG: DUF2249 domain-containing protein [Polyangiaceae bacterium]
MTFGVRREKTDRRGQIIQATLELLGEVNLDQLTTRQIAKALGVSQPSLFRHFPSKDQLLLEVVEHARAELLEMGARVLERHKSGRARLEELAATLFEHLQKHPGLPRLLFAHAAIGDGPLFDALRGLHASQAALLTELVRQGQAEGSLAPDIQPQDAATLFVGLLQGITLSRRLLPRDESLVTEGRRLLGLWLRGMQSDAECTAVPRIAAEPQPRPNGPPLALLDVAPILKGGVDPLDTILEHLARVGPTGVLLVFAPFRPSPLIQLLTERGHGVEVERLSSRYFRVQIVNGGGLRIADLRELEAPEPLERVLEAAATLRDGAVYLARLPRHPRMLLPHLDARAVRYRVLDEPDGSALLRVEGTVAE